MNETVNAANPADVKRLEKAAKLRDIQKREFLATSLDTKQGRMYFWDFLVRAKIFETTFTGDALSSAFLEGQRNLGSQVLEDIMSYCPEKFLLMMQEENASKLAKPGETDGRRSEQPEPQSDEPDADGSPGE